MHTKQFFGAVTLFLTVALVAISVTPAFASGRYTLANQATITSITALANPSQFKITGTIPACDDLVVQKPVVSGLTISIYVGGSKPLNVTCVQGTKVFSTIVSLDAASMNLAPGDYTVMVNPVSGQSKFTAHFVVDQGLDISVVTIKTLTKVAGALPQFKITGTLPTCDDVKVGAPVVSGLTISIYVGGHKLWNVTCAQGSKAFSTTTIIDPVQLKLAPGTYKVLINPVNGQSKFKSSLIVP